MPPAFEVNYSFVAYRTQKRCQVAIVKSHPCREVRCSIVVLMSSEEKKPSCVKRETCDSIKCWMSIANMLLIATQTILLMPKRSIALQRERNGKCLWLRKSAPSYSHRCSCHRNVHLSHALLSFRGFLLDVRGQKILSDRVNHIYTSWPIISGGTPPRSHFGVWLLYLITAAPAFVQRHHLSAAYLSIGLTVCADKIKRSGALLSALTHGNLWRWKAFGLGPITPSEFMPPFAWILNPSLCSFTSHLRTSARMENCQKIQRERGNPRTFPVKWDCII